MQETPEMLASLLVLAAGVYAAVGALFALAFVARGARRIDPSAVKGSLGFKIAIFPGVVALWPILARRWLAGGPPPEERNAHRLAARRGAGR